MDKIIALAKRRGFFYPSSEVYGGLANSWDFGHYGVLLKNNLRDWWIRKIVMDRDDMVMVDSSVILNPKVWQASGHVTGFNDALVECKKCHNRTRADHLIEDKLKKKVEGLPIEKLSKIIKENKLKCPKCGSTDFTDAKKFNLLFETHIEIVEESKSLAYLRGELAQGIFMNFKQVTDSMRVKIPFGIASNGICFRNEITLGQGVFRTLQFDLMEFEYFIKEKDWETIYNYWKEVMWKMALELGLAKEKIRWREHEDFERSHYSKRTMDIEYHYPFGWKEMWGLAYRTDFDLKNHTKSSGIDLSYYDQKTGDKYIPHVAEPTFGLSRLLITIIVNSYHEEEIKGKIRTVLKIPPFLAPVKVAVFPLQKDDKLKSVANKIYKELKNKYVSEFDDSGNIGQMYRRQDEVGTPYCVTIDYQTLDDNSVTIRDRDTMKQERVNISKLPDFISSKLGQTSKQEYKKYALIGGIVVVLLIVGYFLFARGKINQQQSTDVEPTEEIIPTVDSSVKVSLMSATGNREVTLSVKGIPGGTDSVDYELSYQTASQGLQGVIGTVMTEGKSSFDKKLTLGTCSSGTCVYHQVVGKIKLTLKFSGDFGEKLFEKEYEL